MTSKIKVNTIDKKCGSTITIGGSGTNVVLGTSGQTVSVACGATTSGMGRTGTVDWQTTIKTSTFTAVNGQGFFADTSSGPFTMNLPAGSAGAIVSVADYARTFDTNTLTVAPNGSEKIGGVAASTPLTTEGQSVTFLYIDSTQGWINIQDSTSAVKGVTTYIEATGGTTSQVGDYKIHTFTSPGTFTVTCKAISSANNIVDYLVVAGGGGGNRSYGGGGGGGFRFYANTPVNPQSGPGAPLNNYPSGTSITVDNTAYPITVGAGGNGSPPSGPEGTQNSEGSNTTFSTITSTGGGKGGNYTKPTASQPGTNGGSGGGGGSFPGSPTPAANPGGTGNTPPFAPPQGNPGGYGWHSACDVGGGGGGAMATGGNAAPPYKGGNGGAGAGITGFGASNGECSSCVQYFSGGGGGAAPPGASPHANRGIGGGSNGCSPTLTPSPACGAANQGGGGGGGNNSPSVPGNGGSGIVVIRYRSQ